MAQPVKLLFNNFNKPRLTPLRNVEEFNGSFRATSCEPWLEMTLCENCPVPGSVIEISYSAGLTDAVTRPLIRFWTGAKSFRDEIMPAPSLGRGFWRGRLPGTLTAIWICPNQCPGPFFFEIDSIRPLKLSERICAIFHAPKRAFFAFSAAAVGLEEESLLNFSWMLGQAESQDHENWKASRTHRPEASCSLVSQKVIIILRGTDVTAIKKTHDSLMLQTYVHWHLAIIGNMVLSDDFIFNERISHHVNLSDLYLPADSYVLFLVAGDELEPIALDCLLAEFTRRSELSLVYADHLQYSRSNIVTPVLKPGWSPLRQAYAPYVGRAAIVSSRSLDRKILEEISFAPDNTINGLLTRLDDSQIGHTARPLFKLVETDYSFIRLPWAEITRDGKVSVIIPSRDRSDLLETCVRSLYSNTTHREYEVVIVDNGSIETKTKKLYAMLKAEFSYLTILDAPGPFNFSRLCNHGAEFASGMFLLFLNNDTEVIQSGWMENLLELALRNDVGAVGANLLYPNGKLQHSGVVLGFGGVAGHFEDGIRFDEGSGWLGGRHAPREVSAVTGACLMVERNKFSSVGGFDEINLPIELNDIDLCLRLSERGWRTVCDGRTRLRHHCSASRGGRMIRLQHVYEKERSFFKERWLHLIRNDPYYNPNLSLYRHKPLFA